MRVIPFHAEIEYCSDEYLVIVTPMRELDGMVYYNVYCAELPFLRCDANIELGGNHKEILMRRN